MNALLRGMGNLLSWLLSLLFTLVIIGCLAAIIMFEYFSRDLPDHRQLSRYEPPNITRLYAADGKLMAEYATEKRVFVPLKAVPRQVIHAFLAAEDKNFYEHTGIDLTGIARAVRDNIRYYGQGRSLVGGSTITQQVVKNFLLSNEKSIERKIKEAILALRISHIYSKDKILELYLNEIYLGLGSYGVAAAAQNYFNKSLDDLTIEETALLAAQPKAPSQYHPVHNYEAAKERRDWVIDRMREGGFITAQAAADAVKAPIALRHRDTGELARADFFAEEVRRNIAEMYGYEALYEGGLVVKTTLDPDMQTLADRALRKTLVDYDRRRGYRGPLAHIPSIGAKAHDWKERLAKLSKDHEYHLFDGQHLAMVTSLDDKKAHIIFADDTKGTLHIALMKWTQRVLGDGKLGPEVKKMGDILRVGDVVIAGPPDEAQKKLVAETEQKKAWDLKQIPEVNGALVVMDPHTGRVLAMSGGYAYGGTEFNRATQARRQPGSSFKPFVYLAGLENGFTPTTIIMDSPVELSQGAGLPAWKPQNYGDEYYGPITMRTGLEKSRNTVTVRLAQMIGIDKSLEIGKRFGVYDEPPRNFSIVLGTAETTLLRLVNGYGMIVNGGKRVMPSLIERIDNRHGQTIYRRDSRICSQCVIVGDESSIPADMPPIPKDDREQVADPRVAYQMVTMLQGAATRGTGARSKEIGKIVAGKTGTTNDSMDTWFIGFTPDLVAGVYVGYDKPRTLGKKETGASVALPAFIEFMKGALEGKPNTPFRVPPGIQLTRVDAATGMPPTGEEGAKIIEETYISGPPIYVPGISSQESLEAVLASGKKQVPSSGDVGDSEVQSVSRPGMEISIQPAPENVTQEQPPAATGIGGLF